MSEKIFYKEWLRLEKKLFGILAMLADQGGAYQGTLTGICRYLVPKVNKVQTTQRNTIKDSIQGLIEQKLISCNKVGNTYKIQLIPQQTEIRIPDNVVETLKKHEYKENVAWEQVLKVYLWIINNEKPRVTDAVIAADLGISINTISSSKKVLKEYNAIMQKVIREKKDESYVCLGQELKACAWFGK